MFHDEVALKGKKGKDFRSEVLLGGAEKAAPRLRMIGGGKVNATPVP
jgi:hypothetical protein